MEKTLYSQSGSPKAPRQVEIAVCMSRGSFIWYLENEKRQNCKETIWLVYDAIPKFIIREREADSNSFPWKKNDCE